MHKVHASTLLNIYITLFLLFCLITPASACMIEIDPILIEKLNNPTAKNVPALVVCEDHCKSVYNKIRDLGIHVSNPDTVMLGVVSVQISKRDLDQLKSISGISSIEYDEEVNIQN